MAEAIVDDLEAIEVQKEDGESRPQRRAVAERLREPVQEEGPVGQAREGIGEGLPLQGCL
jgi:hypothetical protein